MRRIAITAMAAAVALSAGGIASAAEAQSPQDRREWRQDRRDYERDRREDRREYRRDRREERRDYVRERREDRREYRQDLRRYERWQRAQQRYRAPRYVAPRGYYARSWGYGQTLPPAYRHRNYVVYDYGRYGLRAPPRGYSYYRTGDDVVLAAVATGLIASVIAGLYY